MSIEEIEVKEGTIRTLLEDEKERYKTPYKWVVVHPYEYRCGDEYLLVEEGFLTDGATGGPDYGCSWLFHDYLYATHCFSNGGECDREDADRVMQNVLRKERSEGKILESTYASLFKYTVSQLSYWNPFWCFSSAWESSGTRGPEYSHISKQKKLSSSV
jgi:hypothetical protein